MSFNYSERHIDELRATGVTVFEAIVPPELLDELRSAAADARAVARQVSGPQAQRLDKVTTHNGLDRDVFRKLVGLEVLQDAIQRTLTTEHRMVFDQRVGDILFEPQDLPWCTNWHRDWRSHNNCDPRVFDLHAQDLAYFNQCNCALFEDASLWVVPGSHLRDDLPSEQRYNKCGSFLPEGMPEWQRYAGNTRPELDGLDATQREAACLDYCRNMPGARQLTLNAGDFALYRNGIWHLGNYAPYKQRATLHSSILTSAYARWWTQEEVRYGAPATSC